MLENELSWWDRLVDRLSQSVSPDAYDLWPAVIVLVLALTVPVTQRWGRTLVTVVHEAGHAAVGIACGRKFQGFVVRGDMSGHAITSGKATGAGRVLTSWAGYPAPAILGALLVAGALHSWSGAILAAATVVFACLLVMSRSWRTAGVVLASGLACAALWWWGGDYRSGVVTGVGLVLLVGAWTSLGDVARSRDPNQDHGTLAQLTRVPAGVWLASWVLVDAVMTFWVVRMAMGSLL
ncbi:MAG: M50 family metallopeptidase [Actinomycetaceae bacterium]|nr:M50 family metallopeptidase [Actinomycetaceae bacterium]